MSAISFARFGWISDRPADSRDAKKMTDVWATGLNVTEYPAYRMKTPDDFFYLAGDTFSALKTRADVLLDVLVTDAVHC